MKIKGLYRLRGEWTALVGSSQEVCARLADIAFSRARGRCNSCRTLKILGPGKATAPRTHAISASDRRKGLETRELAGDPNRSLADSVFLDLILQCPQADAEHPGCFFPVIGYLCQGPADDFSLNVFQRGPQRDHHCA